jgi:hypothetical protein
LLLLGLSELFPLITESLEIELDFILFQVGSLLELLRSRFFELLLLLFVLSFRSDSTKEWFFEDQSKGGRLSFVVPNQSGLSAYLML